MKSLHRRLLGGALLLGGMFLVASALSSAWLIAGRGGADQQCAAAQAMAQYQGPDANYLDTHRGRYLLVPLGLRCTFDDLRDDQSVVTQDFVNPANTVSAVSGFASGVVGLGLIVFLSKPERQLIDRWYRDGMRSGS